MVAVITAGGRGTRIASVDCSVPKPMLPVAGKPVLKRQVEGLQRQGIDRIIFTIGYKGGQIRSFFGDGSLFGVQIDYIEEKEPLGTAGALYYLKDRVKEDFLLINGDLVFDVDLHRMMNFHKERHAAATLLVHPNDHPYDSGLIAAGETGQVNGWLSKEDKRGWYQNCANAGIHILSPQLLDKLDAPQKTDLDRDGTINRYVGFLRDIDDFELIDGVAGRIRKINRSGYLAIVVTNQPVIARGEVTWAQLREIHNKMETLLGEKGAYVDDIFVCPHHPDRGFPGEVAEYKVDCDCRKPKPGMLLKAAERYNIDLSESWMLGDSERDMEAGRRAGCHVKRVINVK